MSSRKALQKSYRLLALRPRSEYELRCKLTQAGFTSEEADGAIETLKRQNLLDDEAFAAGWVRWRLATKPAGRNYLRAELQQKGVAGHVIEKALRQYDMNREFAAALALAQKKLDRASAGLTWRRLASFLHRRGFSAGVIHKVGCTLAGEGRFRRLSQLRSPQASTNSPFQGSGKNILPQPNPGIKRVFETGRQWIAKIDPRGGN